MAKSLKFTIAHVMYLLSHTDIVTQMPLPKIDLLKKYGLLGTVGKLNGTSFKYQIWVAP